MTKCGHVRVYLIFLLDVVTDVYVKVFCYPCVLHYLTTSDHAKWNRCPICFDSINEKQLKAVKWIDAPRPTEEDDGAPTASSSSAVAETTMDATPRPGSLLRMRLIQRPQITTLALPRAGTFLLSELLEPQCAHAHQSGRLLRSKAPKYGPRQREKRCSPS